MDKDETMRSADEYVVISLKGNSMESDPIDSTMESDPIDFAIDFLKRQNKIL